MATSPHIGVGSRNSVPGSAARTTVAVRPGSAVLHDAVMAWSVANGASAVSGGLGFGRDGNEPIA